MPDDSSVLQKRGENRAKISASILVFPQSNDYYIFKNHQSLLLTIINKNIFFGVCPGTTESAVSYIDLRRCF